MPVLCVHRYSDGFTLALGLEDLARAGHSPRGLLFAAVEPSGTVHIVVPENIKDVTRLRVGEKLGLHFPLEGRFYHFDSVHRLAEGVFLYNGDRRLSHPGGAEDVAGALTEFLRKAGTRSVFFGCTPHQPGSWIASRAGTLSLHDAGFVEALPVGEGVLARKIMDDRLFYMPRVDRPDQWEAVFDSPLGNILMLERRVARHRLVLTCEAGLLQVDVSALPFAEEVERLEMHGPPAVVGRVNGAFAVTRGQITPFGLHALQPAVLLGAENESIAALRDVFLLG